MPRPRWQLQEAKNRLSELVRKAQSEGPQGKLVDFFRKSPLAGVDLKLGRAKDTGRKVEL